MKISNVNLSPQMADPEFRKEWWRAQLETSVPTQFRVLREQRGLTQKGLATLTGMKQSAIARFENSTTANWKIETLIKLANALDAEFHIELHGFKQGDVK